MWIFCNTHIFRYFQYQGNHSHLHSHSKGNVFFTPIPIGIPIPRGIPFPRRIPFPRGIPFPRTLVLQYNTYRYWRRVTLIYNFKVIDSGVLLPPVVKFPSFPILSAMAYITDLGYRPTCGGYGQICICGPCDNFCYLGHTKKFWWWWRGWCNGYCPNSGTNEVSTEQTWSPSYLLILCTEIKMPTKLLNIIITLKWSQLQSHNR